MDILYLRISSNDLKMISIKDIFNSFEDIFNSFEDIFI